MKCGLMTSLLGELGGGAIGETRHHLAMVSDITVTVGERETWDCSS